MSSHHEVSRTNAARGRNGSTANGAARPHGGDAREDTSHEGLMKALADESRASTLVSKLCFIARARYGILPQDAEDIFHEAIVTYLAIHERYPPGDNHFGLLVGVYHKKSLEFLDSQDRRGRVAKRFVAKLQADRPVLARGEDPGGAAVDRVVREEDAALIRSAIAALAPESRELLLTLADGRMTRLELIAALGVNRNTFDTRLRGVRLRLMHVLEQSGVL